jgi:hypothetical protein
MRAAVPQFGKEGEQTVRKVKARKETLRRQDGRRGRDGSLLTSGRKEGRDVWRLARGCARGRGRCVAAARSGQGARETGGIVRGEVLPEREYRGDEQHVENRGKTEG